jgi:hypothetical protein
MNFAIQKKNLMFQTGIPNKKHSISRANEMSLACTIRLKGYDNYPSVSSKETFPLQCINATKF